MHPTRVFKWYLDMPIRNKLLLWFVPLLVATVACTGVYAYSVAAKEIVDKISLEEAGTAKQVIDTLDYIAQDAVDISNYLYLTPDIQSLLSTDAGGNQYFASRDVIESINHLMVTRPYFQFLTIYSSRFPTIQFNNKGLSSAIPFEEYRKKFHYDEILKDPVIEHWKVEVPNRGTTIFHGDSMNKLLLTKVLKNYRTLKPEGVLILGIDERDIRRSYSPDIRASKIVVMNDDGTVLSDSKGEWIGQPISELPFFSQPILQPEGIDAAMDRKEWVFSHRHSTVTGWHVLVVQPRNALLHQLNRIQWITLLIGFITLLISLAVSLSVSGVITKPIRQIVLSMKKFQRGDFSQNVTLRGNDEIGQLGNGYNTMVQRIKNLIDDVYAFEIKQRQAELKLLQSQINPHFLYNTLNSIAWSAHKNNDPQVADMIYSLSGIFKISLNEGKDVIALQQELELVGHYLSLQKMRFPNKLTYEIELQPELEQVSIPKLLIQPLVENAIVHGIEPLTDDAGFVRVSAAPSADGSRMEIEITDNGVGIREELLRKLNQQLPPERDSTEPEGENFALFNIKNRIRLYYGEGADMHIQSVAGSGTRVLLTLPYARR